MPGGAGAHPTYACSSLAAAAVALALLYTVTPATALGLRGDPSLAHGNTRYAVPALLIAVPVVAWLAGRLPRVAGLVTEAALAATALTGAYRGYEVARPARPRARRGCPRWRSPAPRGCSGACARGAS